MKYPHEDIYRERENGATWAELAEKYDAPSESTLRSTHYRWCQTQGRDVPEPLEAPEPEEPENTTGPDATATMDMSDIARITSLEDLLQFFEVDQEAWDVTRFLINKWEMGAKDKRTQKPIVTPLYQVKAHLERSRERREAILKQLRDDYLADVATHRPSYDPVPYPTDMGGGDPMLAVLAIADPHFGMKAFGQEITGVDQDLKIIEDEFGRASRHLLGVSNLYNTRRILILIGNDGLHVDAPYADGRVGGQTTRGTPQDTDTRLGKMYSSYRRALVRQIDQARLLAPVDVVLVPGNHARLSEYHLAETLAAWYRDDDAVNVRVSANIRQFYGFGHNTLMLTHGEEVLRKRDHLAMIMADECPPELWVKSDHRVGGVREILTGHLHAKLRGGWYPTGDLKESRGVRLRGLSGLTATDAWHHEKGYRHTRAATLLVYRESGGVAGEHEFSL